jgi:hypothetical protein
VQHDTTRTSGTESRPHGPKELLILREYASLAAIEANEEKASALTEQTLGSDQVQMQGYEDRSKYREVVGTKYAREIVLK